MTGIHKRPKNDSVKWQLQYINKNDKCRLRVYNTDDYPALYFKVEHSDINAPQGHNRKSHLSKFFFGELAYSDVERFVHDKGFGDYEADMIPWLKSEARFREMEMQ